MGNHLKRYGGGKKWFGKRVFTGLSGWTVGKVWNFYRLATRFYRIAMRCYRLFPDNSTQVVDFPHLSTLRLFCEAMKRVATDETQIKHGLGKDIEQKGAEETEKGTGIAQVVTDFFTCKSLIFREISGFYAQNRAVITRFLASQARHEMGAPVELFAGAKRGRIFTGEANF
jgi:hypothetical protein